MQDAIGRLASRGIMEGSGEFFNPDGIISRAEFVAAAVMAFDMLDTGSNAIFADINQNAWYANAVASAYEAGLVSGFDDGTFRGGQAIPKDQLTVISAGMLMYQMGYYIPDDVEAILARYLDRHMLAFWSEDPIALATATGTTIHRADGLFAPESTLTRGDAAVVLYRLFNRVW